MALTILNNISALTAQNSLSNTQANLQKTLTQLSTGMKINSGADDAAGLSIANGMQANIAALTQSQQNASNGVGMLQTADGALSQVTTLLNRAVTLATEASNSGLLSGQSGALDAEFTSIKAEIDQIGATTNFNGSSVFSSNSPVSYSSTQAGVSTADVLAVGETVTIHDAKSGGDFVYVGDGTKNVSTLNLAIAAAVVAGTLSANVTGSIVGGHEVIAETTDTNGLTVNTNAAKLGPMVAAAVAGASSTVFISDGNTATGSNTSITTAITALSASGLSLSHALTSTTLAAQALTDITAAITTISATRGTIGASVNRLQAVSNVMANQVQNLTSASNSIQNADIGKTVANMTQYNILQSTGMAALQQANQAQQAVLKLIQ